MILKHRRISFFVIKKIIIASLATTSLVALAHESCVNSYFSESPPPENQIDECEHQAINGDLNIKIIFAYSMRPGSCETIHPGILCRQMASRTRAGNLFLKDVLSFNTQENKEIIKFGLSKFVALIQTETAWEMYRESVPQYDATSAECLGAVKFSKLAVINGNECAGDLLEMMSRLGHCLSQDDIEKYKLPRRRTKACASL